MDELCSKGTLFVAKTVPGGFLPGSDVANMSLLGYDPQTYYTGRAPLEAASMGVTIATDETAFRCNLVTLNYQSNDHVSMVDFSSGHISSEEAATLIDTLGHECGSNTFHFHAGISYRHLLLVKDPVEEFATVPPHDFIGKDVSKAWQTYLRTPGWGDLLLQARAVLQDHPVNISRSKKGLHPANSIWPWGKGKMPLMPSFIDRFGITGTMISAVDLLNGLGICTGLSVARVEGATGYIDTNYAGKAEAALRALETQDFVFVHLEAPDEAGHQARLDHKIQAIEDFDAKIVAPIIDTLRERGELFRVVITMDHFTPLALQTHTAEPVPAILYDSREISPGSGQKKFDETIRDQPPTSVRHIDGCRLINHLLQKN
jgi:2,3-bisphosphoglycerate-independent phosphoglycerate mutase